MAETRLRLGFAGLGRVAEVHLQALEGLDEAEIVAVHDVDPAALARFPAPSGVLRLTAYDALLNSPVDAILILTPPDCHAPMALAALAAGKHVFIEKPIATTAAHAAALLAAAKRAGTTVRVGQVTRHDPELAAMRALLETGALGRPFRAHAHAAVPFLPSADGWRADLTASGGGVLMDIGIHALDALAFVLNDPPFRILAASARSAWGHGQVEDHAAALLEAGDVLAVLTATMGLPACAGLSPATIEVHGTAGWMRNRPLIACALSGDQLPLTVSPADGPADAFRRQMASFVTACRDGDANTQQVARAVDSLSIVLAIYAS